MRGTYSQDLVVNLQDSLGSVSSALITSTSPTRTSSPSLGLSTSSATTTTAEQISRASIVRSTLLALEASSTKHPLSAAKLEQYLDNTFPTFQGTASANEGEGEDSLLLAKFTITLIGIVIQELIREAGKLEEEDAYWREVERDGWSTGMFLLQSQLYPVIPCTSN